MSKMHPSFPDAVNPTYRIGKGRSLYLNFFLFWVLGMLLSLWTTSVYAQVDTYSLTLKERVQLPIVLGQLESKYQLEFAYSYTRFSDIEIAAGTWRGESIESFLFKLLEPHQILFKKSRNRKYLLRKYDPQKKDFQEWDMYLEGRISDRENNIPLSQVAVFLEQTKIGTLSDEHGVFRLKIPRKHQHASLSFRLFAYHELKIPVSQASLRSAFSMKAEPLDIEPIKIQADQAENKELDALANLVPDWEKVAAASNLAGPDMVRTLQLLPGINAFDDINSELKIRGSGGDETLIVLDGIPIYRSDHYFGIFSSISSDYLDKVELYKNILPLEYGGKTGGMLLMKGPETLEEFSAKLDLNLVSSSLNLRVPFGKRNSLVLNGRTTLGNAAQTNFLESIGQSSNFLDQNGFDFTRINIIQTEPDFRFHDFNAKLNLGIGDNSGVHLNLFKSQDKLINEYETSFQSVFNDFPVENFESFSENQKWASTGASVQYYRLLSSKWKLTGNLFVSDYKESSVLVSRLSRTTRRGERFLQKENVRSNSIFDLGAGIQAKRYIKDNTLEIGLNAVQHNTEVFIEQGQEAVLDGNTEASEFNGYANYQIKYQKWLFDIGNRLNYYTRKNVASQGDFYFSPRFQLKYKASESLSLKGAWGISNQFLREIVHENQLGRGINYFIAADGENYPVGRSDNSMLGLTYAEGPWLLDIEGFYRKLDGVVEHALVNPGLDSLATAVVARDYDLYIGEGVAKGVDVYVGYDTKSYTSWLAYTLSKTTNQMDEVFGGEAYASQNDRRHQLKWVNSLSFGDFTFSANYIYSSGRAYLDISSLSRIQNRGALTPADLIRRLPAYHRIDAGISYTFRFGKSNASLGMSVFNLTNRANVDYLQYIYAIPISRSGLDSRAEVIGTQSNLLDRTLNISLKIKFR